MRRSIAKSFFYFVFVLSYSSVIAQDSIKPAIHFRQKFLRQKESIHLEQVDSMRTVHLMIAGNIYQTEKHIRHAYNPSAARYEFRDEFKYVQPILSLGDITIANLKTSFSGDLNNMFSSPDEFGLALKYAGFNGMMHANAHTAYIDKPTLRRTRNLLNDLDMFHTGAFSNIVERTGNQPLIITKKGCRVAILNYTLPMTRPEASRDFVINEADKNYLRAELRMARAAKPDFILVYFDWGTITADIPTNEMQDLVRFAFEQGAHLVVGTAPNIPMRIDYMSYYADGMMKEGIVAYSLGNLIGSTEEQSHRNGFVLDMELRKNNYTGETKIGEWGVIPFYTYYDTTTIPGRTKVVSIPCSAVENGDIYTHLTYIDKRRVVNSAYEVRKLLGSTADELQYNLTEIVADNVMQTIDIIQSPLNNRQGRKLETEIPVSGPPVLPVVASDSSYNTPSLSLIYAIPETQKAQTLHPQTKKERIPVKETAYTKQKELAQNIFIEPVNKDTVLVASKETVQKAETIINNTATISAKVETSSSTTMHINTEKVKEQVMEVKLDTFYRIQIYSLRKYIPIDTNYYTHLKGCDIYEEDGMFKYVLGKYKSYEECYRYWKSQMLPRYKNSFIVTYINGKRILK